MSFLFNSLSKVNETFKKAGSFDSDIGIFSGFTPIDILSANIEKLDHLDIEVLNGGMFNYPYTELGLSAVGKTTLWIQVVAGCIDNWRRWYGPGVSEAIFYNVELHTSAKRWQDITGWDDEMMADRVRFISKPWSIIEIYNDLAIIAKEKIKNRKELEVDTGIKALGGGTIKVLPTTYALIDSIAAIRTKTELEFTKDGGIKNDDAIAGTSNMDAMQIAKANTIFINEVKKLCEEAKICIIMINHLVEIPVLDRYNPPKPQLPGMKFNQKVKGGTEMLYQSFCVGQLSIKERLFADKSKIYGDVVHGIIAFMDWLKNKNGPEGVRYPMVFDSATGYKPELTDFEILYECGQYGIEGSPLSYRLSILPEITFTRKTLLEKCYENPILARALGFTTRLYLVSKVVNREEPIDLKGIADELDFEHRIYLIMSHSIDYPGYVNFGRVVPEEYEYIANIIAETVDNPMLYNKNINNLDIEFAKFSKYGFIDTNSEFSICDSKNKSIKIGQTEYTMST